MILDTDEQVLKRPFDKPLSYNLLKEVGCTMLVGSEHMVPDLWRFTYKGQEILFNSSCDTDYDDFTSYEIGRVTTVVLYTNKNIYVYSLQDFLDGLDKCVEYQIEQKKSFIIEKSNNGKTHQQPVQRDLLRKQRLPKFQKSIRCYCSPGMFRHRNR